MVKIHEELPALRAVIHNAAKDRKTKLFSLERIPRNQLQSLFDSQKPDRPLLSIVIDACTNATLYHMPLIPRTVRIMAS